MSSKPADPTPEDIKSRSEAESVRQKITEEFEKSVMLKQEAQLIEDKRIKIIPETLTACILPDFMLKVLPHGHTKKVTDQIVQYSREYEGDYATESERYDAEIISTKKVLKLVLLNPKGEAFSDKDFEDWANKDTVGLGALNKLSKKLYVFLVVQGGKVGLGY